MVIIREATVADIDTLYSLIISIAEHHEQAQYVLTSKTELEQVGFSETSHLAHYWQKLMVK